MQLLWEFNQLQGLQRGAPTSLPQTIKPLLLLLLLLLYYYYYYRLLVLVAMVMDAMYKLWITMSVMETRMMVIATPTCRLSLAWHATVQERQGDINFYLSVYSYDSRH